MMGEIVLISHCNLLNVFSLMWSLSLFFLVGKGLCKQRENFFIEIKIEKSSPCLREGPRYFKINIIKLLLKQHCRTRVSTHEKIRDESGRGLLGAWHV